MGRIYTRVTRIASWAGWCTPCEREDRPLVLTRSGPGGLRSWLSGLSDEDRLLLLTCRVCGNWQFVPAREEDDPEVVLSDVLLPVEVVESVTATLQEARALPSPSVRTPAVEDVAPADLDLAPAVRAQLSALAAEAPAVPVPAPAVEAPVAEAPAVEAPEVEAPVVEAPAAALPQQRPSVPRIVTVPDPSPARSAVSPEAVAAAARVLAAARAQAQRTPSAVARTAPLDRSRRSRSGPTPRRATRTTTGRSADVTALPVQLPPSIALPVGTSQVVLAAAS